MAVGVIPAKAGIQKIRDWERGLAHATLDSGFRRHYGPKGHSTLNEWASFRERRRGEPSRQDGQDFQSILFILSNCFSPRPLHLGGKSFVTSTNDGTVARALR